jgi:bifunctional non-homologous end joining protein LigD
VSRVPSLKEYRRKRDFAKTTEPPPGRPRPARGRRLRYMIHRHDARRLHYDLRLEIGGALASWAVPKGPSLDPADRRLAVQTEDHPLEYGEFEGRIPDDEYGGGDSLIWDRGTWDTDPPGQAAAMRERGRLTFVLRGEKLQGRWHLIRTRPTASGKAQWLLFKGKDEHARAGYDVVAGRPESVASGRRVTRGPVSAKALAAPHPDPIALLVGLWPPPPRAERRRALAAISGGRVALQSGEGRDLAARHPAIARALAEILVPEAVIDGGLRRGRFVASDLWWLDGEDLRRRPAEERHDLLASLLANAAPSLALARAAAAPRGRRRTGRRAARRAGSRPRPRTRDGRGPRPGPRS